MWGGATHLPQPGQAGDQAFVAQISGHKGPYISMTSWICAVKGLKYQRLARSVILNAQRYEFRNLKLHLGGEWELVPWGLQLVCSSRGKNKIAKWVGFSLRCGGGKDSKSLAASAAQSKSSARTYLSVFRWVRKLSGSVQRQTDLYDYWDNHIEG